MLWVDYVENIDDSHPMTTAKKHIKMICDVISDKAIDMVEFGSYYGYSTAAFALASPMSNIISVDLSDHISEQNRVNLWNSLNIKNIIPYTTSTQRFLQDNKKHYDVIFHDAAHGKAALGEYFECAKITNCLIIHDFEQLDTISQNSIKNLFSNIIEDYDNKGRCLLIAQNIEELL